MVNEQVNGKRVAKKNLTSGSCNRPYGRGVWGSI